MAESGAVKCPICDWKGPRFEPVGRFPRPARCPSCNSLERHRALYLYLRDETSILDAEMRLLHFAPETCLRPVFERRARRRLSYVTTDLEMADVSLRMDIEDLWFKDGTFDCVICSHVLEHVPDDRVAMQEIARVLRPNGYALVMVPIVNRPHGQTHDDPGISSPEERERHYGQRDHVRAYSYDFPDRVRGFGLEVESVPYPHSLGQRAIARYELTKDEQIFLCRPGS